MPGVLLRQPGFGHHIRKIWDLGNLYKDIGALQGKKSSLHGYIGVIPGCKTEEHPLDMCIACFAGN